MVISEFMEACQFVLENHGDVEVVLMEPGSFQMIDGVPGSSEKLITAVMLVCRGTRLSLVISGDNIPNLPDTLKPTQKASLA